MITTIVAVLCILVTILLGIVLGMGASEPFFRPDR